MKDFPRLLFAAPKSGSGKTMITCGFLADLKRRGLEPCAFKCGPDYIDPLFHRQIIGVPGHNMDSFFADEEELNRILQSSQGKCAVFEGVMGIYDGLGGSSRSASSYEVAELTRTPIVLILDVKGMGNTAVALLRGILEEDEGKLIRGIVFNRCNAYSYEVLCKLIGEMLIKIGRNEVEIFGYLPALKEISIESRHLGLQLPEEIKDLRRQLDFLADAMEESMDIDGLISLMKEAEKIPEYPEFLCPQWERNDVMEELILAVARDEAFSFYYEENMSFLRQRGVTIREFSPLHDKQLPQGTSGLLLGGGYPELHLESLSANIEMMDSIRTAICKGMPSLAECGGFLYLHESIRDLEGNSYQGLGLLQAECHKEESLKHFGYIRLEGKDKGLPINGMKAHEFHYYQSSQSGAGAKAVKPVGNRSWDSMHIGENHAWGFPHLYYPSCPEFVDAFLNQMRKYQTDTRGDLASDLSQKG